MSISNELRKLRYRCLSWSRHPELKPSDEPIDVVIPIIAKDLFMLSECDYVMGPPSTYSLVAVMYRDIPLLRMDTAPADTLTIKDFKLFDYWFRRII